MYTIRVYNRETDPRNYPDGLARSIHFALVKDGVETELNRGYGILFAKGSIRADGTIQPKGTRDPEILRLQDGRFMIKAVRVLENGDDEEEMTCIYWISEDLIHFEEKSEEEICTIYKNADCCSGSSLSVTMIHSSEEITDEEAEKLLAYWNPPYAKPLTAFPQSTGLADPVFFRWENKWYFIFTNDNLNDIGLYIREGDSIDELLKDETPMHCILDYNEKLGFLQTFWAPEIHVIGDDLYILFAVGGEAFGPCCHMMKLKKGGKLTEAASYETPVPILRKDGSILTIPEYKLTEEQVKDIVPSKMDWVDDRYGISLDMTYLKDNGRSYMLWSFRQHIGTPLDSGSMIMIAETTEETPWKLISDPVLLSRPMYGYENVRGTINNEGPYVYKRGDVIHVNYSGGDARGYLYMVNLLSAKSGSDLLDPASWEKRSTPICNFTTYPDVYGPGHNSWFRDENGKEWIAFHAVENMQGKKVSVGIFEYPENL